MLKSCYRHDPCRVGIVGPTAEILSSFKSHERCAITLTDYGSSAVPKSSHNRAPQHKLQPSLVSISTATKLQKILQNLKTSQWWDHMAPFLIMDTLTPLDQGCSNAFEILSTAWKMNLLHAKFICRNEAKGLLIYSYNPYTNQALISWQLEKRYRRKNENPWTLLVRSFQDNPNFCKDLDFDKTKYLGGHEIRASVYTPITTKYSSTINLESLTGLNAIILRYMFRALNCKSKIFIDSSENAIGMTTSGFTDIYLNTVYQQNNFSSSMTYPFRSCGPTVITQPRGNLSQIGKLLRVIDRASRYAVVIVGFIAFLFFKFFLRQSVTTAILTIVRLICNAAVPNIPDNVAARIFLSVLFMFLVTLQAIYQGKLASLLTKPVALPNVETFEDLDNFEYTTYGHKQFKLYFEQWNLSEPFVPLEHFTCIQYVLRDKAAACINDWRYISDQAIKYDLHLSNVLMQEFEVFLTREDWPLQERLNTVISRLNEGNIIKYVFMKDIESVFRKQDIEKKDIQIQSFTVMILKDLAFAFAILGIGLTTATVVFFVEVWMGRR